MTVSIIIPTLNESAALPATLDCLDQLDPAPHEIIIVDAGSEGNTPQIAAQRRKIVIQNAPRGRAVQMNLGVTHATGNRLCFLHADTEIPRDFISLTEQVLADERTALAGFVSIMRGATGVRRVTSAHNFIKTWYAPAIFRPVSFLRGCRLLFGDQVIICRRADFDAIGGWSHNQAIMEEADLCLRMVRAGRGRVRQVSRKVWSSDRRVAEWGFWRANLTFLYVGMMWGFGARSEHLARHYEDVR